MSAPEPDIPVRECRNDLPHPPHVTAFKAGAGEWLEARCPGIEGPAPSGVPDAFQDRDQADLDDEGMPIVARTGRATTVTALQRQDGMTTPSERSREARELAKQVFTPEQQTGLHIHPNRSERRKAAKPMPGSAVAWFCTALDGKVHVVQSKNGKPKRTTICGRNAQNLADDVSTKKNRCKACARVLA